MSQEIELYPEVEVSPFVRRLQRKRLGRVVLCAMNLFVAAALIVAGYIGAEAVNSGIKLASHPNVVNSQPILATSSAK